jgi:hypothetical protein
MWKRWCLVAAIPLLLCISSSGQDGKGLQPVPFEDLSDKAISALGQSALQIRRQEWKHAESANFIYHFFHGYVATPVSIEAEFYYRYFAKELGRDNSQWERKSHIFIFEEPPDWKQFQLNAQLDPWTGGIHANGELFVIRNPAFKFKGHALGHEIAHLVLHRFFGPGIPLWLNEGYAEYASNRAYASFYRARGYRARPHSQAIAPGDLLSLVSMLELLAYPSDERQIGTFYDQSEKLVRFFCRESKTKFVMFLEGMSHGNRFESALWKAYGGRFASVDALEREFRTYATKDHGSSLQD